MEGRRGYSELTEEEKEQLGEERVADECDLLIVGGGPAGLAAAIRFRQLCLEKGLEKRVCLVEKGAEIGFFSFLFFSLSMLSMLSMLSLLSMLSMLPFSLLSLLFPFSLSLSH